MAATTTVDEAARQALASACERVEDATAADEVDGVARRWWPTRPRPRRSRR